MISISQVVGELIERDEAAREALGRGVLNLSAYAREIKGQVEQLARKPVDEKSIVIAASRLSKKLTTTKTAAIKLSKLIVHPNLVAFTVEKTQDSIAKLNAIFAKAEEWSHHFFTVTASTNEITIISQDRIISELRAELDLGKPVFFTKHLVGLTAKFSLATLQVPNAIYTISKQLAVENINIVEIVSSATEITYIVRQQDGEKSLKQLSKLVM